eukprot:365303-Chlamydomonas_euryale.AAC.19
MAPKCASYHHVICPDPQPATPAALASWHVVLASVVLRHGMFASFGKAPAVSSTFQDGEFNLGWQLIMQGRPPMLHVRACMCQRLAQCVVRHFSTWIGSVPATSSNFKRLLRKGSVAVIVGGIAEIFMGSAVCENAMVLTRKGFVRVAVEEGIDGGIVPVYHMGNSLEHRNKFTSAGHLRLILVMYLECTMDSLQASSLVCVDVQDQRMPFFDSHIPETSTDLLAYAN